MTIGQLAGKADSLLLKVELGLIIALLASTVSLSLVQMVWRWLGLGGFFWIDTVSRHAVFWIALVGASIASQTGEHLSIDALKTGLPDAIRRPLGLITQLAAAAVSATMLVLSIRLVASEITFGGKLVGQVPLWISQVGLIVGFGGMTVRLTAQGAAWLLQHTR